MLLYTSEFTLFENEYPELDEDKTIVQRKKWMMDICHRIIIEI